MWDERIGRTFSLGDRDVMADPRWWGGEPLWITAERQGKRSASFFWPGSDVAIHATLPTYYRVYDGRVSNARRVAGVLDWLALPPDSAPAFVTLYMSDVDGAGHEYGPGTPQVDSAIARVDSAVGALAAGLAARGLDGRVNLVVVSDHGMAPTSFDRQIFLDDYLDLATVRVVDWSPVAAIIPAPGLEDEVYARLHGRHPRLAVYRRADLPPRWHYDHERVTPIVAVADDGWHIASRARPLRRAGGNHGYDDSLASMSALFIGVGPAFKRGAVAPPFRNIHLYELIARIIGVTPAPNDGSLDSVRALLR
jgi:predicted AlkP superfamily pyrophosphatase or phosphodiesterase